MLATFGLSAQMTRSLALGVHLLPPVSNRRLLCIEDLQ